uniref:Thrombospondin-like N-terminal domain-containing protein n=1 Tax=Pelusios castaneus TaxID=367368 RepID=A0A8C8SET5_9SAUR
KPVDVLRVLGLRDGMEGISITSGICPQRRGAEESDLAFRLENGTQLSAPTRQLFPDGPFPEDFSILGTLRARRGTQAFLLSLYDERGLQQLGVEIGRSPVFLYEDQDGQPTPERYPHFRRVSLADGKWHRVALSVEGTNVSLLVDCEAPVTLPLERGARPVVSTAGITLLGARLLDEAVFEVGPRWWDGTGWDKGLCGDMGGSSSRAPLMPGSRAGGGWEQSCPCPGARPLRASQGGAGSGLGSEPPPPPPGPGPGKGWGRGGQGLALGGTLLSGSSS